MLAFTFGPGGAESAEAIEYVALVRKEALAALKRRLGSVEESDKANLMAEGLEVLSDAACVTKFCCWLLEK